MVFSSALFTKVTNNATKKIQFSFQEYKKFLCKPHKKINNSVVYLLTELTLSLNPVSYTQSFKDKLRDDWMNNSKDSTFT